MKHIAGWFRRNKDLARQLQEAWDEKRKLADDFECVLDDYYGIRDQLHRVARERDKERKKRIDAEMLAMEFISSG